MQNTKMRLIEICDFPIQHFTNFNLVSHWQREIILYGNTSTDDHGIEEWEWTKGPKDSGKAVDMQVYLFLFGGLLDGISGDKKYANYMTLMLVV